MPIAIINSPPILFFAFAFEISVYSFLNCICLLHFKDRWFANPIHIFHTIKKILQHLRYNNISVKQYFNKGTLTLGGVSNITYLTLTFFQNCTCAAQLKSYLLPPPPPSSPPHHQRTKMLPISDDEFVVTFNNWDISKIQHKQ